MLRCKMHEIDAIYIFTIFTLRAFRMERERICHAQDISIELLIINVIK